MIVGDGVEKRYGRKRALKGVSFSVPRAGFLLVTGPNGSGKTTLLRLVAGLAAATKGTLTIDAERGDLGYVGHEPLLYRELTALENLDLFGRLYRVPERRERSGMLLERFGLWDVRGDRVSTYSRGMTQRLALCRALLHDPALLVLDEPFTALDEEGPALLDRELTALTGERTIVLSTHDPDSSHVARDPPAGPRMSSLSLYTSDVVALARKDLKLELRARDTLPAMLLFVLSTLAVFHFALPAGTGDDAAYGLLWIAIIFTALLGLARAWAPEREGGALDGLVLAPCDRSAIWLGKSLATLAFLAAAELVAIPAFALFFAPVDAVAIAGVVLASIGICAVGTLLAAMAAVSRGREVILPLLFLPLAIPLVVGGVGAGHLAAGIDLPVIPRPLRPRVRDTGLGNLRICRHGITSRSSRLPLPACSASQSSSR